MPPRSKPVVADANGAPEPRPEPSPEPGFGCGDPREHGVYIFGVVVNRSRRFVGQSGDVEVVSYSVNCGDQMHRVDEFRPPTYHGIGEAVQIKVLPKAYKDRGGVVHVGLAADTGRQGEF